MADIFTLKEAEKYINRFRNELFVIKYGGAALESSKMMPYFLKDIAELYKRDIHIVLVHGGGRKLSEKMKEKKINVRFHQGLRFSTSETVKLADEVFSELNKNICDTLDGYNCHTVSHVHGKGIQAELIDPSQKEDFTGKVKKIDFTDLDKNKISVISSLGTEYQSGRMLNINADHLAVEVAILLKARKIIFISDVNGIYLNAQSKKSKLDHVTESDIQKLIQKGILKGGMKLKIEMALKALKSGINKAHFIDGSLEHSILKEIFTDKGIGTEIVHDQPI